MTAYIIEKVMAPPPLNGQVENTPWEKAQIASLDCFPWYESGARQKTQARVLYDVTGVYLHFYCQDNHIFSKHTDLNGLVCLDSCVEFFASPDPATSPDYFNFEANCCGVLLMGFGGSRHGRKLISPAQASSITITTSEAGSTRSEKPDDRAWWLAAKLPFDMLSEFAGRKIQPRAGDVWRGNFYRCGGKTGPQYACWHDIDLPQPDFHCPNLFGEMKFS